MNWQMMTHRLPNVSHSVMNTQHGKHSERLKAMPSLTPWVETHLSQLRPLWRLNVTMELLLEHCTVQLLQSYHRHVNVTNQSSLRCFN